MKLSFNKDGFVTGVTAEEGIDEFEIVALHVLNACDGLPYDEAVAFLGTIIESVSQKYHKINTTVTTDVTMYQVQQTTNSLEEFLKNANKEK